LAVCWVCQRLISYDPASGMVLRAGKSAFHPLLSRRKRRSSPSPVAEFTLFRWSLPRTRTKAPRICRVTGRSFVRSASPESCRQPPYVVLWVGATTRRNPICYPKVTAINGKFLVLHLCESLVQDGSKAQVRMGEPPVNNLDLLLVIDLIDLSAVSHPS